MDTIDISKRIFCLLYSGGCEGFTTLGKKKDEIIESPTIEKISKIVISCTILETEHREQSRRPRGLF